MLKENAGVVVGSIRDSIICIRFSLLSNLLPAGGTGNAFTKTSLSGYWLIENMIIEGNGVFDLQKLEDQTRSG